MENTKIRNTANVIDRILKILQGVLIAVMIVCAVLAVLVGILGDKMVADAATVDFGCLKAELAGDGTQFLNTASMKPLIITELAVYAIAASAGWYFLRVLREILVPMKEGRPFEAGISNKIMKLGWTALVTGGIAELASKLVPFLDIKCYDLSSLFNREAVTGFSFSLGVNTWWFVVVALVLFFLSFIFRCGEQLQKEADETL